jgi:hypothetical protein
MKWKSEPSCRERCQNVCKELQGRNNKKTKVSDVVHDVFILSV